ncbi:MAG: hypothetical protein B6I30_03240 [Desulfobacteraceae bacterium 4572_187]|nr:MAG: hypothetical protein B6I30_03240 [Desulfobacteraceae bacterium 4572_187]
MDIMAMTVLLTDNGGRRIGVDRRQFSYTNHIPDRRRGHDRRTGLDRRSRVDRRNGEIIIKKNKKDLRKGKDRRSNSERRVNFSTALAI